MRGNLNNHPFPVDFGLAGRRPWVGAETGWEENRQLGSCNWFVSDRNDWQGISVWYQWKGSIKSPTHQAEKSDVRRHSTSQSERSKQGTNAEQEEEGAATKAAHQPLTQDPLPASFCTLQGRKNQSDEHDGGQDRFSATDSHSWYVHCTIPTQIWHF